jgi:predicted Zn-dependent protease with MMP-like domain
MAPEIKPLKPALTPPSLALIETLAQQALAAIPAGLAEHVKGVVIRVEDFPDTATLRGLGLKSPFDLLGLYRGTPLVGKSPSYAQRHIDMIFLYRRPILDYWCRGNETLDMLVRHVLIHEIGHHFGFSDADMEKLERES